MVGGKAEAGGGEVGEESSACENPPLLPVPAEVAPASETSALGRSGRVVRIILLDRFENGAPKIAAARRITPGLRAVARQRREL
ncbi:hypothetical protein O3P69_000758 [Scylla paramamosain]|uniref:Uncharacterized protein n=1 Tax=Scylla paramamosain TaxID=85552 RepID=A0AAW0UR34_SCYPA